MFIVLQANFERDKIKTFSKNCWPSFYMSIMIMYVLKCKVVFVVVE